jgi:prepilin-type processing-associated H-X9-DG protein
MYNTSVPTIMNQGTGPVTIYPAQWEIPVFYCPSRRQSMDVLKYQNVFRVNPVNQFGGGNDYGGCIGSGQGWLDSAPRGTYALTASQLSNYPLTTYPPARLHIGMFFVNSNVSIRDITDGTSQVIAAGEVMRLNGLPNTTPNNILQSSDGWAWGGAATMFSARFGINKGVHYDNPGSSHPNGVAQFVFADGSVHALSQNINLTVFNNLANIANGIPVTEY